MTGDSTTKVLVPTSGHNMYKNNQNFSCTADTESEDDINQRQQGRRSTQTHVTFSRPCLIFVAHENCEIRERGYYFDSNGEKVDIKDALQNSMTKSTAYHYQDSLPPLPSFDLYFKTKFHIYKGSSIDALQLLISNGGHVGVLNSASGKTPGGKWLKGTLSQEDVICRASLLYPCLEQFLPDARAMYHVNNNNDEFLYSSSGCCIYSPNVPVIRQDDNVQPQLLDTFFTADILSMPAPNAFVLGRKQNGKSALKDEMFFRLRRALTLFANHGCTDLVLCAFGCGIHGNNPQMVASSWKRLFSSPEFEGRFQTVVFAINPLRPGNYTAFQQELENAECS